MSNVSSKRIVFRWTALKGLAAIILFFIITLFLEILLVYSFQTFGLTDGNVWTGVFQIPATQVSFTVSVSPLLHLLPLTVLIVLVASWTYLTKYTAVAPVRIEAVRRPFTSVRREVEKRRFRALRRFSKSISRRLQRVGGIVSGGVQRIRGFSYLSKRLHFARAAVRSALTVFAVFLGMSLLLYVIVYPDFIYRGVINLYQGNPGFLGFVKGTTDVVRGVGQALAPLNDGLISAAPSFRNGLSSVGAGLTVSVVSLDVLGKFVFSQNVAAWTVALVALMYGFYRSSRHVRRR